MLKPSFRESGSVKVSYSSHSILGRSFGRESAGEGLGLFLFLDFDWGFRAAGRAADAYERVMSCEARKLGRRDIGIEVVAGALGGLRDGIYKFEEAILRAFSFLYNRPSANSRIECW